MDLEPIRIEVARADGNTVLVTAYPVWLVQMAPEDEDNPPNRGCWANEWTTSLADTAERDRLIQGYSERVCNLPTARRIP